MGTFYMLQWETVVSSLRLKSVMTKAQALLGDNGAVPSSAKAPKIALGMSLFTTDEEHTLAAKGTTDSGTSALILEWR